jgi:hypothetical protein
VIELRGGVLAVREQFRDRLGARLVVLDVLHQVRRRLTEGNERIRRGRREEIEHDSCTLLAAKRLEGFFDRLVVRDDRLLQLLDRGIEVDPSVTSYSPRLLDPLVERVTARNDRAACLAVLLAGRPALVESRDQVGRLRERLAGALEIGRREATFVEPIGGALEGRSLREVLGERFGVFGKRTLEGDERLEVAAPRGTLFVAIEQGRRPVVCVGQVLKIPLADLAYRLAAGFVLLVSLGEVVDERGRVGVAIGSFDRSRHSQSS